MHVTQRLGDSAALLLETACRDDSLVGDEETSPVESPHINLRVDISDAVCLLQDLPADCFTSCCN